MKKNKIINKKFIYIALSIIVLIIGGSSFIAGYYFATNTRKTINQEHKKPTEEALKELQKLVDENINHKPKSIPKKVEKTPISKPKKIEKLINSEAVDYKENTHKEKTEVIKKVIYTTKPKLVIIMDDMSFNYQVKTLKKLGIKVTPSFFPPSTRHPNTSKYAKEFKHYMVHFPMQAMNPNFREEPKTLHIDSTYDFILNRVTSIKAEFPRARFINNHTGSKFTANYNAMKRLFKALNKEHMIFVDSKTTSKSKARLIARQEHIVLLSRDVFLDNKPNVYYIQNQLRQAVRIAKKRGYAIAICHPHSKTFEALAKSKGILKNVEVIYIDELYKLYQNHKFSRL